MAFNLRNRNFLKLLDFTPKEIKYMLDLAADLKKAKYAGTEQPRLKGKNIALIFKRFGFHKNPIVFDHPRQVRFCPRQITETGHFSHLSQIGHNLVEMLRLLPTISGVPYKD